MTLEREIEAALVNAVKAKKGWAIKMIPYIAGLPDRLVLLPGAVIFFVELKRLGKEPTAIQRAVHRKLRALGFDVFIIDSKELVNKYVNER